MISLAVKFYEVKSRMKFLRIQDVNNLQTNIVMPEEQLQYVHYVCFTMKKKSQLNPAGTVRDKPRLKENTIQECLIS